MKPESNIYKYWDKEFIQGIKAGTVTMAKVLKELSGDLCFKEGWAKNNAYQVISIMFDINEFNTVTNAGELSSTYQHGAYKPQLELDEDSEDKGRCKWVLLAQLSYKQNCRLLALAERYFDLIEKKHGAIG